MERHHMRNIVIFLGTLLAFYALKDAYFPRTITIYKPEQVLYIDEVPEEIERQLAIEDLKDGVEPIIPFAVPIIDVEVTQLDEPYPWANDDGKGALLDCDKIRDIDRIVLACNIYHEARSESVTGQWMVALCTRNRIKSDRYGDTYSEVVWDFKNGIQFSWAKDGSNDRVYERDAWRLAWTIAGQVINDPNIEDFTGGCLYYHAAYLKKLDPWWNTLKRIAQIDTHIMYKD